MTEPRRRRYELAGIGVDVAADSALLAELVDARLAPLPGATPGSGATASSGATPGAPSDTRIELELRGPGAAAGWPMAPDEELRTVYDAPAGPIGYAPEADELFVVYDGAVRMRCAPAAGSIQLGVTGTDPEDPVIASHFLLTLALMETMKRFARFPVHAGVVAREGRGLLIPGTSGAGKSTLTLALVRAGCDFLTDDTAFLERCDGAGSATATGPQAGGELQAGPDADSTGTFRVHGFPDEVDVTGPSTAFFPELAHLTSGPRRPGRQKFSFRVEEAFGATTVPRCAPVALVFPQVVDDPVPRLTPLAAGAALFELTPNVLLTEPVATQAHLDALGGLLRAVPSFRLELGPDLPAAAALVLDLLN